MIGARLRVEARVIAGVRLPFKALLISEALLRVRTLLIPGPCCGSAPCRYPASGGISLRDLTSVTGIEGSFAGAFAVLF